MFPPKLKNQDFEFQKRLKIDKNRFWSRNGLGTVRFKWKSVQTAQNDVARLSSMVLKIHYFANKQKLQVFEVVENCSFFEFSFLCFLGVHYCARGVEVYSLGGGVPVRWRLLILHVVLFAPPVKNFSYIQSAAWRLPCARTLGHSNPAQVGSHRR